MAQLLIKNGKVVDVVEAQFPVHSDFTWLESEGVVGDSVVDSVVIPFVPAPEPELTVDQKRRAAYSKAFSVTDQIDIMQKQIQSMIDLGEVTPTVETTQWLTEIARIKTDNPKPVK